MDPHVKDYAKKVDRALRDGGVAGDVAVRAMRSQIDLVRTSWARGRSPMEAAREVAKQERLSWKRAPRRTKAEMIEALARDQVRRYPQAYAGHYEDAVYFVKHEYPTWDDLELACENRGC